ncbi:MAG: hypothetical protein ACYDG4_10890 [Desulfuromonadaceae bacterium]
MRDSFYDYWESSGVLKFSQITEMSIVDNPKVYAKILEIRENNKRKLNKYMFKISLYIITSIILSYFGAARIAMILPYNLYFIALLIPVSIIIVSLYISNEIQRNYKKLIDYETYFYFYQNNTDKT